MQSTCVRAACFLPLLDSTCMCSQSIHARGSLYFPCMRPFTRAAFDLACLLSLPSYACDQIHSPRLFRLLLGTLSILQLSCGCSSLYPLVSKPAFNLHASMPVESKPWFGRYRQLAGARKHMPKYRATWHLASRLGRARAGPAQHDGQGLLY